VARLIEKTADAFGCEVHVLMRSCRSARLFADGVEVEDVTMECRRMEVVAEM
jgi:hypothetical protein